MERFTKNKKRKIFVIGAIIGICVSIGGIFLYKSYAYYENEKEYNVIKGIIPDFSYDVKFAIEVDGTKQDNIPTEPKDKSKNTYYEVKATCDDGIKAEWDYNAWNLKVDNITKGTKCTLAFNSTLTETDYQKYIEAGVAYRKNTYRGKDLTDIFTKNSTQFYQQISSGHFDDIFVGDYIKTTNSGHSVTWLVADIDNYLYNYIGNRDDLSISKTLTQHHLTIIPAAPLILDSKMYNNTDNNQGYANSDMFKTTLPSVLSTYIAPVFSNHIITYHNVLTNKVTDGKSSLSGWYERQLDLMSEVNVYGATLASSSALDVGLDITHYALFQLKPQYIYSDGINVFGYWLKGVANSTNFTTVGFTGEGGSVQQNNPQSLYKYGVRPRFLIG